jgi:peptidase M28-like protein
MEAMILVDMVARRGVKLRRDSESTKWLNDLIWAKGKSLSFGNIFVDEMHTDGGDDHFSFLKRGVAASDLVDYISCPYWYTPQDAMDKIDPAGMQAASQNLLEVLPALEERRE